MTIQKNGTNVQTFTANQSTNATANITVPTALSDLTADYEHKRFILQCMASDVMFGFTDAVKELFLNHTEENTFEQIWINNEANIDIDTYEDIITCCTYNDTTIKNGKVDHHVEYPWIKKEDGFHYIP